MNRRENPPLRDTATLVFGTGEALTREDMIRRGIIRPDTLTPLPLDWENRPTFLRMYGRYEMQGTRAHKYLNSGELVLL